MSETPDPGTNAPATYLLATQIPGALGYEHDELERVLPDTFEYDGSTVALVINGTGESKAKTIGSGDRAVALPIYAGSIFVVIDGKPTVTLTPAGGEWFYDPFEGGAFGPDHPVDDVELFLLRALHARLTELGEELPPLEKLLDGGDA